MKLHNILTFSRVVLAPLVVALILYDQRLAGAVVYGAAAATDLFDGYFARKYGFASERGDLFDAGADCFLVYLVATALALKLRAPWLLALICLTALLLTAIVVKLWLRNRTLSLPHLRSAKILAFFVHAIVIAYIAEWSKAPVLVMIGIVPGLYAVWEYATHAAAGAAVHDQGDASRRT